MNWQKIYEKTPKGKKKWDDWLLIKVPSWAKYESRAKILNDFYSIGMVNMRERMLYDFFDEQGLHICLTKAPQARNYWVAYIWDITSNDYEKSFYHHIKHTDGWGSFGTRTEAEEQAFIKAFEILEGKL